MSKRGSVATRFAAWLDRGAPVQMALPGVGSPPGVPVLTDLLGTRLYLVVEVAFGGSVSTSPSTWNWTDVTEDIQVANNGVVSWTLGRGDQASTAQPAVMNVTLDNRANKYSQSPAGPYWPNVVRGTPVRVRLILDSVSYNRFQGYATGFTPTWDSTALHAVTKLAANGVLYRLNLGNVALQSALRGAIPTLPNLVAYWPMEDGNQGGNQFVSGVPGGAPAVVGGSPTYASSSAFAGSSPLPVLNASYVFAQVGPYVSTNAVGVKVLMAWPVTASALPDGTSVLRVFTTGTIGRWDIFYHTAAGGSLQVVGSTPDGATNLYSSGVLGFAVDGVLSRVGLNLSSSGGTITIFIGAYYQDAPTGGGFTFTTSGTIGVCQNIWINPAQINTPLVVGHLSVENQASDVFSLFLQFNAFANEFGNTRLQRLSAQSGLPAPTIIGSPMPSMGRQSIDTPISIMREVETTDHGVLADGLGPGLTYFARGGLENQPVAMTVDLTSGAVLPPFAPVDDDVLHRNTWTVTQKNGNAVTASDTGLVGSEGPIADSLTANWWTGSAFGPLQLATWRANWQVHETTVAGYRYPTLAIMFHKAVSVPLLQQWLAMGGLMSRVQAVNAQAVFTQMPVSTVDLMVQGYTETLDKFTYTLAMNCSLYDPWRVVQLAADTGDTSEFLCRLSPDAASVTTLVSPSATSFQVTTTGPLWTTTADDFPLVISAGGIPITVTNITGASSPQTFTVDPTTVTVTLPAGTAVDIWRPTVLAL